MINLNENNDLKDTQEFKALIVENHKNLIAQIIIEAFDCANKVGKDVGEECKYQPHGVAYLETEGFDYWTGLADFDQATIANTLIANNGEVNNTRYITETLCPPAPKHIDVKVEKIDIQKFLNELSGPDMDDMDEVVEFENDLDWSDPV